MENLFDDRYGYPGMFSIYRCTSCGFGQIKPEVSGQALDNLYTQYYPRKNMTASEVKRSVSFQPGWIGQMRRWLDGTNNVSHYYAKPGMRVLDIGCGNGASLLEIQAQGAEAYGTELDQNVAPIAKELNLNIHFGDIGTAPWPDHYFDLITMSQLMEHIPKPAEFLNTVRRLLKPGGQIIMSFPNVDSFNQQRSGAKWINWHIPYHMNFFTPDSIQNLAKQVGMQIRHIKTTTPAVWLMLQSKANDYAAQVGIPSPVWTATPTAIASPWKRRWQTVRALCNSLWQLPYTRWQDAHGKGDSYIVWFS